MYCLCHDVPVSVQIDDKKASSKFSKKITSSIVDHDQSPPAEGESGQALHQKGGEGLERDVEPPAPPHLL